MEEISAAYNDYLEAYDTLCSGMQKSSMSVMKGMLSLKLTERDEILMSMLENKRLALTCVKTEIDGGLLSLNLKSTLKSTEKKKHVTIEGDSSVHNRKRKEEKEPVISSKGNENEDIKVIDPIRLIHGGFAPLSIRASQKDASNNIIQIINVINKRRKVLELLCNYE